MVTIPPREWRTAPGQYRPCTVQYCGNQSSERYPVPFCQEHILYIWSLVEGDMRRQGITLEKYSQQQLEQAEQRVAEMDAQRPGVIYYLEVGEYLKIGHTKNLYRRMREYPPNARLLASQAGSREEERALHHRFSAYCDSGREWYRDVPEIREHIAGVVAQEGKTGPGLERKRRSDPGKTRPRLRTKTARNARYVL